MIILSNCLTRTADEGSLNIANSLIRRIKRAKPETTVVSYERHAAWSDMHLPINKFLLNGMLIRLIREKKEPVLYVPFPTRMLPAALRIFILSRFARRGLRTMLVMQGTMGRLAGWLIKHSGAEILTVSRSSWETYREIIGSRAVYLRTGVDTKRFAPVDEEKKAALREKYGLPQDKPIVLHVGHMNPGRNIGCMLELDESWHGVLVVSTTTAGGQDMQLRRKFAEKSNIKLLDTYCPAIEEIYQLSDVYLFPVVETGHCIDVPLSALEAASCGIPVVTTAYGEMQELTEKKGFYQIESFDPAALNDLLERALAERISPRESVLEYDWNIAVEFLLL